MKLVGWAMFVLGIWIFLSPWTTNFSTVTWFNVVAGLVIALLGLLSGLGIMERKT